MTIIASLLRAADLPDSPTARLDVELLLAAALGKSRSYLHTWPEKIVSSEDALTFADYLQRRRSGEPVAYILGQQWLDHRIDPAGENFVERVQRQVDPVVGDPALGKVVGTNPLRAITGTDQQLTLTGNGIGRGAGLLIIEFGRQPGHRPGAVLVLGAFFLALHDNAGRQVRDANGRVSLVDVLTAGTRGFVGIDAQIRRVDLDSFLLIRLGQHRHGAG